MHKQRGTAGRIIKVTPQAAIPGGEVFIECENFPVYPGSELRCFFNNSHSTNNIAASARRVIATVPGGETGFNPFRGVTDVTLFSRLEGNDEVGGYSENGFDIVTGQFIAGDLHLVASPAVDPDDGSLIVTRSGSRGQQLPVTMFRLRVNSEIDTTLGEERTVYAGDIEEITGDVMNPTGIAFSPSGEMYVSSRAEGTIYKITGADEVVPFASEMGIATGLAFDQSGDLYVGDRSGTIYKVNAVGDTEVFATIEQSIAAYHLAFGADGALYVTRPNVSSFDSVMRIEPDGEVSTFYRGLGRPQGLAFDRSGNLYVAACLRQRRGIVKISPDGRDAELFVSGMNMVGLCFGKSGEMYVATNEAVFRLDLGIYGTLL